MKLSNYMSSVEKIFNSWNFRKSTINPWFRGQTDASWDLNPSIYRGMVDPGLERELSRDYILKAEGQLESTPKSYIEWLFLMQHYNLPTRCLDWTESSLVALFFAVCDEFEKPCDSAVWVLHPWNLNYNSIGHETIPHHSSPKLDGYALKSDGYSFDREIIAEFPVAVRPPRNFARIRQQKGMFTIHGKVIVGLNQLDDRQSNFWEGDFLKKITIPYSSRNQLLRELYTAGISRSVIFPDLDSLAKETVYRYSKRYRLKDGEKELVDSPFTNEFNHERWDPKSS